MTQVGNGGNEYNRVTGNSGAGPNYGIFKLGHKYHFIADPSSGYLQEEPFFNGQVTKEKWDAVCNKLRLKI